MGGAAAAAAQAMKRIPSIKFPQRHPKPSSSSSSSGSASTRTNVPKISISSSDVPASPANMAVGGKASLQPKRTPVTDQEIEAIMAMENSLWIRRQHESSKAINVSTWEAAFDEERLLTDGSELMNRSES